MTLSRTDLPLRLLRLMRLFKQGSAAHRRSVVQLAAFFEPLRKYA